MALQAAQLAAPLEKRFQKRLARDATGAEQDDRTPAVAKKPRTAAKATGTLIHLQLAVVLHLHVELHHPLAAIACCVDTDMLLWSVIKQGVYPSLCA